MLLIVINNYYNRITTRTTSGCVFGGSGVGNRKQSPDNTGQLAAEEFLEGISDNNCVDNYLQDQVSMCVCYIQ